MTYTEYLASRSLDKELVVRELRSPANRFEPLSLSTEESIQMMRDLRFQGTSQQWAGVVKNNPPKVCINKNGVAYCVSGPLSVSLSGDLSD